MKNQIILSFSEMQPVTLQGNKSLMSAELAHQKADKHLCVALRHKVRIRLHPPMALRAEIFAEYCYTKGKECSLNSAAL